MQSSVNAPGKRPAVVIYDTDGREGRFEYRIRIACRRAGVRYEVFRKLDRSDRNDLHRFFRKYQGPVAMMVP